MLALKNFGKIFQTGEGNEEISKVYSNTKIFLGNQLKLIKDFQNRKTLFCKLFTGGRHVWSHLVCFRQTSRLTDKQDERVRSRQMSSEWVRSCQLETSVSLHLRARASLIN